MEPICFALRAVVERGPVHEIDWDLGEGAGNKIRQGGGESAP